MAARSPSSVNVGGIRMSTTATSGRSRSIATAQRIGVGDGGGDLESAVEEQLDQPVAEDGRILGDGDPERHGR